MSFTSPAFLPFLALVLLLLRRTRPARRWLPLLLASCFFYACHNVLLLGLVFSVILTGYLCALAMEKPGKRRRALALALCVCLGTLFFFKYLRMAAGGANLLLRLLGKPGKLTAPRLALPMGISFYVFQSLSYVLDVYRGRIPAEKHLGYFALYVLFFPQLVAGPIERPGDLIPQLRRAENPDSEDLSQGVCHLVRGYAKKVLIADCLAPFVDAAYASADAGGAALLFATALFAAQIYCDFSGYSDIAVGCARLMGIRLTENFDRPYRALTIRDFWRRWHISLTRWFTDYLYIPLGGSRKGIARQCVNTLLVFLVSGLWHGADMTFVIWGGLHGLFLIAEILAGERFSRLPDGFRRGLTLLGVIFAFIFFRAESLPEALSILRAICTDFRPGGLLVGLAMNPAQLLTVLALLLLLPTVETLPAPGEGGRKTGALYYMLLIATVLARCLALTRGGDTSFIYFQF